MGFDNENVYMNESNSLESVPMYSLSRNDFLAAWEMSNLRNALYAFAVLSIGPAASYFQGLGLAAASAVDTANTLQRSCVDMMGAYQHQ
jgi:hypothetical protein